MRYEHLAFKVKNIGVIAVRESLDILHRIKLLDSDIYISNLYTTFTCRDSEDDKFRQLWHRQRIITITDYCYWIIIYITIVIQLFTSLWVDDFAFFLNKFFNHYYSATSALGSWLHSIKLNFYFTILTFHTRFKFQISYTFQIFSRTLRIPKQRS